MIGLLGAGGIGGFVGREWQSGSGRPLPGAPSLGAMTRPATPIVKVAGSSPDSARVRSLASEIGAQAVSAEDLAAGDLGWVLEAAGVEAAARWLPTIWRSGTSTVVMSAGVFARPDVMRALEDADQRGARVVVPSGAIAGLDCLRALAAIGALDSVTLETTKAPAGLAGAPALRDAPVEIADRGETTVFTGSAREAIAGFPANANVAVILALNTLGLDRTRVTIKADPVTQVTRHRVIAVGEAASIEVQISSRPTAQNPRTSFVAAASALSALRDAVSTSAPATD